MMNGQIPQAFCRTASSEPFWKVHVLAARHHTGGEIDQLYFLILTSPWFPVPVSAVTSFPLRILMMKSSEAAKVPIGLPTVTKLAVDIVKGDSSGAPVLRFWSFGCTFIDAEPPS